MNSPTDALLLRLATQVGLFAGMPKSALQQLLARAEQVAHQPRGVFFGEGEDGDTFYVLVGGRASVDKKFEGKWVTLAELVPGDTFGEMILVDEKVRSARVRAKVASVALAFKASRLQELPEAMMVIYRNIARLQTRRLKSLNAEIVTFKVREAPPGADTDDAAPSGPGTP